MDLTELFAPALDDLKAMIFEVIGMSLPYILKLVAVVVALKFGFWFFSDLLGIDKPRNLYLEQEQSFGKSFYDENGELDAIAYGDFDSFDDEYISDNYDGPIDMDDITESDIADNPEIFGYDNFDDMTDDNPLDISVDDDDLAYMGYDDEYFNNPPGSEQDSSDDDDEEYNEDDNGSGI